MVHYVQQIVHNLLDGPFMHSGPSILPDRTSGPSILPDRTSGPSILSLFSSYRAIMPAEYAENHGMYYVP